MNILKTLALGVALTMTASQGQGHCHIFVVHASETQVLI